MRHVVGCDRRGEPVGSIPGYHPAMTSDAVRAAYDAGRAAWPDVAVELGRFTAHVAAASPEALARHGADLYLACGCAGGDTRALRLFDDEILVPAARAVRSIDDAPAFADEVCQRLRASLLVGDGDARARIVDYAGRGPLRAWVGVAAVRHALMLRRGQQRQREVSSDDDWTGKLSQASTGNPELDLVKKEHAAAFGAALRDAAAALDLRLRAVMRMHFVDGLSIDEIGAAYGVHRATAARWIQRARDELFAGTRTRLAERLALSPSELDRVTALVQSQLDVSLSTLLPPQS
jgi:RNA polymerase sigma-70 factor, ECF subfamily